jgi:hypothetical protein
VPLKYDTISGKIPNCGEHFIRHHGHEHLDAFMSAINRFAPDYLPYADSLMRTNRIYLCNMYVMKRWVFEKYSKWLFSFLAMADKEYGWTQQDGYQRRMPAFAAERLLNIYIAKLKQDYPNTRIKEVPYVLVQQTNTSCSCSPVNKTDYETARETSLTSSLKPVLNKLHQAGKTRIYLYGAGKHTQTLLSLPELTRDITILGILDDNPKACAIQGVPVRKPGETTLQADDAILISSDSNEIKLLEMANMHYPDNTNIFTLYNKS